MGRTFLATRPSKAQQRAGDLFLGRDMLLEECGGRFAPRLFVCLGAGGQAFTMVRMRGLLPKRSVCWS